MDATTETHISDRISLDDFKPGKNWLLLEVLPPKTRIGKIVIPEQHQHEQGVAWVRKVGPLDADCPYREGMLVLFRKGAGDIFPLDGRDKLLMMPWRGTVADDIYGYVEGVDRKDNGEVE